MKKILSVLFLLCFIVGIPCNAQKLKPPKGKTTSITPKPIRPSIPFRTPKIVEPIKSGQPGVPVRTPMANGVRLVSPESGIPTVVGSSDFLTRLQQIGAIQKHDIQKSVFQPLPSNMQLERRGFVPTKHLSAPLETLPTTKESSVDSPMQDLHFSPPKVNIEKLRIKVKKKQNRLNKDEMISDKYIKIGLLIYQNEYGEYYITGYAA